MLSVHESNLRRSLLLIIYIDSKSLIPFCHPWLFSSDYCCLFSASWASLYHQCKSQSLSDISQWAGLPSSTGGDWEVGGHWQPVTYAVTSRGLPLNLIHYSQKCTITGMHKCYIFLFDLKSISFRSVFYGLNNNYCNDESVLFWCCAYGLPFSLEMCDFYPIRKLMSRLDNYNMCNTQYSILT